MTKQLEAMKMALEALETCDAAHPSDGGYQWYDDKAVDKAITSLREAIEAAEVLFDGYRVLKALTPEAATRTTHVNVSDVLDAVVALMREGTAPKEGAQ